MSKTKCNKNIHIKKDSKKSYVHIYDKEEHIGFLAWDYKKKNWVFERG